VLIITIGKLRTHGAQHGVNQAICDWHLEILVDCVHMQKDQLNDEYKDINKSISIIYIQVFII
jgi:hypothetical protein